METDKSHLQAQWRWGQILLSPVEGMTSSGKVTFHLYYQITCVNLWLIPGESICKIIAKTEGTVVGLGSTEQEDSLYG